MNIKFLALFEESLLMISALPVDIGINLTPLNAQVKEHENVTLQCSFATLFFNTVILWEKNNDIVHTEERVEVSVDKKLSNRIYFVTGKLNIRDIETGDMGQYRCTIIQPNSKLVVSRYASLTVQRKEYIPSDQINLQDISFGYGKKYLKQNRITLASVMAIYCIIIGVSLCLFVAIAMMILIYHKRKLRNRLKTTFYKDSMNKVFSVKDSDRLIVRPYTILPEECYCFMMRKNDSSDKVVYPPHITSCIKFQMPGNYLVMEPPDEQDEI